MYGHTSRGTLKTIVRYDHDDIMMTRLRSFDSFSLRISFLLLALGQKHNVRGRELWQWRCHRISLVMSKMSLSEWSMTLLGKCMYVSVFVSLFSFHFWFPIGEGERLLLPAWHMIELVSLFWLSFVLWTFDFWDILLLSLSDELLLPLSTSIILVVGIVTVSLSPSSHRFFLLINREQTFCPSYFWRFHSRWKQ